MKLVAASKNKGKLKELSEILSPYGYEIISADDAGFSDDVEETGETFLDNAKLKAYAIYNALHLPTIADDSGLMVNFLNGAPGVYSARYAPVGERCNKILSQLNGVPDKLRGAKFVCTICFIDESGKEYIAVGECKGKIGYEKKGENGFGYDPIFERDGITLAQMTDEEKNAISHRGEALRKLVKMLEEEKIDK